MPLTTVSEGRVYDWSHAIGRNAARGPGFNYVQTMCLGKNGVLYATNRGNENNFGMHVNKVKLGGPGEEEHIADFCEYGEGDGKCTWPFGVAVDDNSGGVELSEDNRPIDPEFAAEQAPPAARRPAATPCSCASSCTRSPSRGWRRRRRTSPTCAS